MKIRIAFWGTPELTAVYLDALDAAGMTPVVIVTNPDRPKGRGQELAPTPAKMWAQARGIPVLEPEKMDEAFAIQLGAFHPDISIVVAYGSIIPERLITLPEHKTLNVHYSLLPRFRGASPTEAAILAGDEATGVAIQVMAQKLDSGPIVAQEWTPIGEDETAPELRARLTDIGARLLVEKLPDYLEGRLQPVPQDEISATRCGKMHKEDGLIDPEGDALSNYRKYRAYFEWPRTYFFIEQTGRQMRVIITEAAYENDAFVIKRVLPEGKKEMNYADFLRGLK